MAIKQCVVCGGDFVAVGRRTTCSAKCRKIKNARLESRKRLRNRKFAERSCRCGVIFQTSSANKITCSAKCAEEKCRHNSLLRYESNREIILATRRNKEDQVKKRRKNRESSKRMRLAAEVLSRIIDNPSPEVPEVTKNRRAKHAAYMRQWSAKNPDKKHEADRKYAAKSRDIIRRRYTECSNALKTLKQLGIEI